MNPAPVNLNLKRRLLPGLLALAAAPPLRVILKPFRRGPGLQVPLTVFASYMVGDLFMALPALKRLAAATDLRVICRPDCEAILAREGFKTIPFENAFFTRRTPAGFLRTVRAAWSLRGSGIGVVLDLDADPRSALWMRLAGSPHVVSFARPFGVLFDETFPLPPETIHQQDRDFAVVAVYVRLHNRGNAYPNPSPEAVPEETLSLKAAPWLLSVWTRKTSKNWPLARWGAFMDGLIAEGVAFAVLDAPDGDDAFRRFKAEWYGRVPFVAGPLETISQQVRASAGIVATDNFLGHMGGYFGKPVLWINLCSPAAQVAPRGPRTLQVEAHDGAHDGQAAGPTVETVTRAFAALRDL